MEQYGNNSQLFEKQKPCLPIIPAQLSDCKQLPEITLNISSRTSLLTSSLSKDCFSLMMALQRASSADSSVPDTALESRAGEHHHPTSDIRGAPLCGPWSRSLCHSSTCFLDGGIWSFAAPGLQKGRNVHSKPHTHFSERERGVNRWNQLPSVSATGPALLCSLLPFT